jgi:hypothetical protein
MLKKEMAVRSDWLYRCVRECQVLAADSRQVRAEEARRRLRSAFPEALSLFEQLIATGLIAQAVLVVPNEP